MSSERVRTVVVPELADETLLYATAKLTVKDVSGKLGWGTGFFFRVSISDSEVMDVLVTNVHVIRDAVEGRFRLHQADSVSRLPNGKFVDVTLDRFESRWVKHPDPAVDLCAMPIVPLINAVAQRGGHAYYALANETQIKTDGELLGLGAIENVVMPGYPKGLIDDVNNYPVMRRGTTATHPAVDHDGESYTLVDIACFPGSSGSPIVILEENNYYKKQHIERPTGLILVGILAKGPVYNKAGQLTTQDIPVYDNENTLPMIPISIGYAIKAKELKKLADHLRELKRNGRIADYIPADPR